MGHAGLVAEEGSQVARLGFVITRERLYLTSVTAGTLAGQEAQRAVAWRLELTMTDEWEQEERCELYIKTLKKESYYTRK